MCATQFPRILPDGAGGFVSQTCTGATASSLTVASAAPAASAVTSVPVSFSACDPFEHYADVSYLWLFGIGLCFVAVAVRMSFGFLWRNQ
jgi:hypothetical protein